MNMLGINEITENAAQDVREELSQYSPEEQQEKMADAAVRGMRRAFRAGVMFGANYYVPGMDEDYLDAAFDTYMLAELVNALEAKGVDVSGIDAAILSS